MRAAAFEDLMRELCVELGFCLSEVAWTQLEEAQFADASAFARAVFIADELDPDRADPKLFYQVRDCIAEAMRRSA